MSEEVIEDTQYFHVDPKTGILHRCYHRCKKAGLTLTFWISFTFGYPFEHWLWEHVWPFKIIGAMVMGH